MNRPIPPSDHRTMTGVNEIRSTFLDYFARNGHPIEPSGPLVPRNDPTLMFANSGMVQFKNVFTGLEKRDVPRATTAQKCVRAGGKHNDLDNVGYTARHHTFFEMLGNFSFGDYFKEQAIAFAWELLTKELALPQEKLLVTVYHDDDEAAGYWKKIAGLSDDRIIRIATADNFWSMGDTGPCGPSSEIFFDHGDHIPGGPPGSPDEDGDRFIEIWNLVFMQFEQIDAETREPLPRPSIDTGSGLERVAAVLQGTHDNYEIDLFRTLIAASEELTGTKAEGEQRPSHRVIADHLRSSAFLLADGVLPSNEGRGYVLRRIMRRAMRHASLLGARDPLMHRLVPTLVGEMGGAYPELVRARPMIEETLELEEARFRKTLARGLDLLNDATADMSAGDQLDGETAFKLYDTFGFPLDLTQDALRRREITVDEDAFNAALERQKEVARASWSGSGSTADERIWFELRDEIGASEFLGYETESAEAVVRAIVDDGARRDAAESGAKVRVVCNQTPFYAESGGQVGDHGRMRWEGGSARIVDAQKRGAGLIVHDVVVEEGTLSVGAEVAMEVDHERRAFVRANHSATHLIHEALRAVLGDHVAQKGSLVSPERLRFDISHNKPLGEEEMRRTEALANEIVLQNAPVSTTLMAVDDAIERGARALFGEKYGDEVRVVEMGTRGDGSTYSLELCGGTHVGSTGEIGPIAIVSDGAVSAGVRRIEALSGEAAREHLAARDALLRRTAATLKVTPEAVPERVATLMDERRRLEREVQELRRKLASGETGGAETKSIGDVRFSGRLVEGVPAKELKGLVDQAKSALGSGIVAFVTRADDGKAGIVVGVSDDLTDRFDAVKLVREAAQAVGGKGGGGRPDMAQAGGPDGAAAQAALDAVERAIAA